VGHPQGTPPWSEENNPRTRAVNPKGEQQRVPGQAFRTRDSLPVRLGGHTRLSQEMTLRLSSKG